MVTLLSGGTGTPKVLWGAGDVFPRSETTVVANTGDDMVLRGLHVSPDVDTVLFERGGLLDRTTWWGLADDPTTTNDRLAELSELLGLAENRAYLDSDAQTEGRHLSNWRRFAGVPEFMTIGDRDRAHHIVRTHFLEQGETLTTATQELSKAYGLTVELLPMSDDPVATLIQTPTDVLHFQEFWVQRGGSPTVTDVEFRFESQPTMPAPVADALTDDVVIGPANPVTSIGPMRTIGGFESALSETTVVAVSPFLGAAAFSGPAASLMRGTDREPGTKGFAEMLPFVDAFVLDSDDATAIDRHTVRTDTLIRSRADSERVARACERALAEVR